MTTQPRAKALEMIRSAERIFICYSHSDLRRARDVRARLVKLRRDKPEETVFFDQLSLLPGEDVSPAVIDRKLTESSLLVLLCGEDTPQRVEVQRELELAATLRDAGTLAILPVILKAGVKLPARVDYRIQAIQLTILFPEILWARMAAIAAVAAAIAVAAFFSWRSFQDRAQAARVSYGAMINRLTEQVDQELAPGNPNRSAEKALLVAREAYNLLDRADEGHTGAVEVALRKALSVFPPFEVIYQEDAKFELNDLAISSDGRWIAAAYLGHVQLFDSGRLAHDIVPGGKVVAVRFSPDDKSVGAVTITGRFCAWEISASTQPPCWSLGDEAEGEALEVDPRSGDWIAGVRQGGKGEIRIQHHGGWTATIPLDEPVSALAVGPDGTLYVAGEKQNVFVLPPKRGQARPPVLKSDKRIERLALTPDGKYVAGLVTDLDLLLWRPGGADPEKGVSLGVSPGAVAFDPRGRFMVAAGTGSIEFRGIDYMFDLLASKAVPCSDSVRPLALARNASLLVLGCNDIILQYRLPQEPRELRDAPGKRTIASSAGILEFHPANPDILAAAHGSAVDIIDLRQKTSQTIDRSRCLPLLAGQLVTLGTFAADSSIIALQWTAEDTLTVVQRNGEIWTVNLRTRQPTCDSVFLGGRACQWTASSDGQWNAGILESAGIPMLSVWPKDDPGKAAALDSGSGPFVCSGAMAFHPRQAKLYGSAGIVLKSWTYTATDKKWNPATVQEFEASLSAVAVDREGEWLAAAGGRGQLYGFVWLWHMTDSPAQGRLFRFPESEAKAARFGAHGRVAVAFTDGTLRVWNTSRPGEAPATYGGAVGLMDDWNPASRVQTAQSLARVLGPVLLTPRQVDAIAQQPSVHYSAPAFNADGNLLAVSVGSRIQVLDAGIEGLASEACAILPRNLSWQDWLRLAPVGEPYDLTCPQRPVERSVVAEGDRQAKDGHDAQAIAIYRRVAALGGAISPEGRLDAWRQYGLVTANIQPDRKKLSVALKAYRRFKADDGEKQTGPIPYAGQLRLCRWSTLLGEFREALEVCDEAVNLLSDGMAHDSRGLARALSGDLAGARADFEKSADYIDTADWRTTRQAWVEALKKGQNPITPEVVKKIVAEDLAQ